MPDEKLKEDTAGSPGPKPGAQQKAGAGKKAARRGESVYSVHELAADAKKLFRTNPECVLAALKADGKAEYSLPDAEEAVRKFLKREVG